MSMFFSQSDSRHGDQSHALLPSLESNTLTPSCNNVSSRSLSHCWSTRLYPASASHNAPTVALWFTFSLLFSLKIFTTFCVGCCCTDGGALVDAFIFFKLLIHSARTSARNSTKESVNAKIDCELAESELDCTSVPYARKNVVNTFENKWGQYDV